MRKGVVSDKTDQIMLQTWEEQTEQIEIDKSYSFTKLTPIKIKTDTYLTLTTDSTIEAIENLTDMSTHIVQQQNNHSFEGVVSGIEIQQKHYCKRTTK